MNMLFHFAYLDPGTGSLIIQSVIGAIAGIVVFGRHSIVNAKNKIFAKKNGATSSSSKPADQIKQPDDASK